MPSTGRGRLLGVDFDGDALIADPTSPYGQAARVTNEYFWAAGIAAPPPPTEIPLCWFTQPVPLRLERAVNDATVTQSDGAESHAEDADSVDDYTVNSFAATLSTRTAADARNLASHTVRYGAEPRTRSPQLTLDLMHRTDIERWRILRVRQGDRITLTGVPAEFPTGADSLVISGIQHQIGLTVRRVQWTTTAVVGSTPGVPGPWFYTDDSLSDGTDLLPF